MQSKFKRILFGGDYNPNQWPKEVWEQDAFTAGGITGMLGFVCICLAELRRI